MKSISIGLLVALVAAVVAGRPGLSVSAQSQPITCRISGSAHPELMPEYFVWELFFRAEIYTAKGTDEGLLLAPGQRFLPEGIRQGARAAGIAEADYRAFLEVGENALARV